MIVYFHKSTPLFALGNVAVGAMDGVGACVVAPTRTLADCAPLRLGALVVDIGQSARMRIRRSS